MNCKGRGQGRDRKVAEGGFHRWNSTILPDLDPKRAWGRSLENADLNASHL